MESVDIRVELEGRLAQQFAALKKRRGLRNNTEVIRQLVAEAADREREEERKEAGSGGPEE